MNARSVAFTAGLIALLAGLIWLLTAVFGGLDRRTPGTPDQDGEAQSEGESSGDGAAGTRTGNRPSPAPMSRTLEEAPLPENTAELIEELDQSNEARRVAICRRLGEIGETEGVTELGKRVLVDSATKVRVAAVRGIVRARPDDVVKQLTGWLDHFDERVRAEALTSLARLADAAALAPLMERVRRRNYRPRWMVIDALASMQLPAVASELARIATDAKQPKEDRLRALGHLGGFRDEPAATDAIEVCRRDADEDVAEMAQALK